MAQERLVHHPVLEVPERPEEVVFTFNGVEMTGHAGETIAAALLANGEKVFGRHPRDGAAQGIFCANGQCGQCLVLADGRSAKACLTPVQAGLRVRALSGPPELPPDDAPVEFLPRLERVDTDVLIVGGGPAGLSAADELGSHGVQVTLCDDKSTLGGKLSLQTHNFFGSVEDCHAGERGMEIGRLLAHQVRSRPGVDVWTESPVVGIFQDGLVGVVRHGRYTAVRPRAILVASGAREKALAFPGADLPGVYGAGAFQTLVNRDLVLPSKRLLVVGAGNVGLIVAYQALQAGIDVVAVVELLPTVGGYKVHQDKILRLGIPVLTSTTVQRAEGKDWVERAIVAAVDDRLRPLPGTERAYDVDTILLAVGLTPVNELFEEGRRLGLRVYAAGDAHEIAEASSAMVSGRIVARTILRDLGQDVEVPGAWEDLRTTLASHPGPVLGAYPPPSDRRVYPVIRCAQEIPCNPCTAACPKGGIAIPEGGILGRPRLVGECVGCVKCVAVCPGLAITMVDRRHDASGARARVTVPWEMPEGTISVGQVVPTTGFEGEAVGVGSVVRVLSGRALNRRRLVVLEVPGSEADRVAGIRVRVPESPRVVADASPIRDSEIVVCRCERITKERVVDFLRTSGTRDVNAVKAALRSGMGPCGGKTCTDLILRVFRELGVSPRDVTPPVHRPFVEEVPILAFLTRRDDAVGV